MYIILLETVQSYKSGKHKMLILKSHITHIQVFKLNPLMMIYNESASLRPNMIYTFI